MHPRHHRPAFTLIELLIVIAILGVLATIVLVSLGEARKRARDVRRISDIRQLQIALELYHNQNNQYPQSFSDLIPTLIPNNPVDPSGSGYFNNGNYFYVPLGDIGSCIGYHMGAVLENSSDSALANDSDASSSASCVNGVNDFDGTSQDCGSTAGPPDQCYDIWK